MKGSGEVSQTRRTLRTGPVHRSEIGGGSKDSDAEVECRGVEVPDWPGVGTWTGMVVEVRAMNDSEGWWGEGRLCHLVFYVNRGL